jgi:serine/threonine protein kinase
MGSDIKPENFLLAPDRTFELPTAEKGGSVTQASEGSESKLQSKGSMRSASPYGQPLILKLIDFGLSVKAAETTALMEKV